MVEVTTIPALELIVTPMVEVTIPVLELIITNSYGRGNYPSS